MPAQALPVCDVPPVSTHEHAPTRKEFGEMVLARLRAAGATSAVRFDEDDFAITEPSQNSATTKPKTLQLEGMYDDFLHAAPEDRDDIPAKLVRVWNLPPDSVPDDYQDAVHHLLPAIRCRSWQDVHRMRVLLDSGKLAEPAFIQFADHLALTVSFSLPDVVVHLDPAKFRKWGVTPTEAMQAAMKQLAALPHPFENVEGHRGAHQSAANDGYDASRILLPSVIRSLHTKGAPVAMVPHASYLFVAGEDDPGALEVLIRHAEHALAYPRSLSGFAFCLRDDRWMPWLPETWHPLYNRFCMLQLATINDAYLEQRDLLNQFERMRPERDQCFVAGFAVDTRQPLAPLRSATVWTIGLPSLLPKADDVHLVRWNVNNGSEPVGVVSWARFAEVMGDRLVPLGLYPERYQVRASLNDAELAALTRA